MAAANSLTTRATGYSTFDAKCVLVGISGATRSGKGTLAAGLCRMLAPGLRVSSICQDDFARSSLVSKLVETEVVRNRAQGFEHSESTDWAALRKEVQRRQASRQWDVVIVEGFRVFYDAELSRQMHLCVWIDICKETCRARRQADSGNGMVTQETFEEALWPLHEEYRGMTIKDRAIWNVAGEQDSEALLADAVARVRSCFDTQEEQLPTECTAAGKAVTASKSNEKEFPSSAPLPISKRTKKAISRPLVRVEIVEPWLSHIVSGNKSHEGRVHRNTWAELALGDVLDAYSERFSSVKLRVRELLRFDDFDKAFEALGKRLLPEGANTPADALQVYRQWNPADVVRKCGGVVAVGVEVLEAQLRICNA